MRHRSLAEAVPAILLQVKACGICYTDLRVIEIHASRCRGSLMKRSLAPARLDLRSGLAVDSGDGPGQEAHHLRPRVRRARVVHRSARPDLEVLRLESQRWVIAGTWSGHDVRRAEPFAALELDLTLLWDEPPTLSAL